MKLYALVSALAMVVACGPAPTQPSSSGPVVAPAANPTSPAATPVAEPVAPVAEPALPVTEPVDPVAAPANPPTAAKSGAPVAVKATFSADKSGAASLDLVFSAEGKDVRVDVYGVDGLTVTKPATSAPMAAVRAGQAVAVAVEFTAPASKDSNLAVRVTGTFGGHEQSRVQSFTVRATSPAAKEPTEAPVTDKKGRKLKVMTPK